MRQLRKLATRQGAVSLKEARTAEHRRGGSEACIPAGLQPDNTARSTAASVWPGLSKTPPSLDLQAHKDFNTRAGSVLKPQPTDFCETGRKGMLADMRLLPRQAA